MRWEHFMYNDVEFQFATTKKNNKKSNQIASIPKIN